MQCLECEEEIPKGVASIATIAAGIEYVHSYWFCTACNLYTRSTYKDNWSGDADIFGETMSREVGDSKVATIRDCPSPRDKFCLCPVHKAIGVGW